MFYLATNTNLTDFFFLHILCELELIIFEEVAGAEIAFLLICGQDSPKFKWRVKIDHKWNHLPLPTN